MRHNQPKLSKQPKTGEVKGYNVTKMTNSLWEQWTFYPSDLISVQAQYYYHAWRKPTCSSLYCNRVAYRIFNLWRGKKQHFCMCLCSHFGYYFPPNPSVWNPAVVYIFMGYRNFNLMTCDLTRLNITVPIPVLGGIIESSPLHPRQGVECSSILWLQRHQVDRDSCPRNDVHCCLP